MVNLRYPPSIQWEVTSNCNHNCIHCYNYWRKDDEVIRDHKKQLTEEQYLEMSKKIIELKPVSIVVTGGEPFLVFDRIKSSLELLLENNISISFNSNVALVDEKIVDFLVKNKIGVFVSFPCSNSSINDFITNTSGSFYRVLKSLDLFSKYNVSFLANMVVSTANLDYVEETVKFLHNRYNIKKVSITRVGKPVNSTSDFDRFLLNNDQLHKLQEASVNVKKNLGVDVQTSCPYTPCSIISEEVYDMFGERGICTAGKTTYAIDTEGNVKACPRDGKLYGNILKEDFAVIWDRMAEWRDGSLVPEECKDCNKLKKCFGGCRVGAYPTTGKMNLPDVICDLKNVPVKFSQKRTTPFTLETKFKIDKNIMYLEEECGIRASANRKYMYLKPKFYEFMKNRKTFTFAELKEYFGIDDEMTNAILKALNNSLLIHVIE